MRLGIFGGSFDPPHIGHLLAAGDAYEQLRLDELVFVPASMQPLKGPRNGASSLQRLEMVRLLVGSDRRFSVSSIEVERPGLSYTVDTLTAFAGQFPEAERFFLLGADAFATFDEWREPQRIRELARLAVMRRVGDAPSAPAMGVREDTVWLSTRWVDVSSTEIRDRVQQGRPIRGLVTEGVAEFIASTGLYRSRIA